jgi:hypothetical protein
MADCGRPLVMVAALLNDEMRVSFGRRVDATQRCG